MNALEVSGLSKSVGDFQLQNVGFTLPMGCALGLVGENGAGKSTTISLLLGLLERDGGTVRVLGHELGADFEAVKEDIGVVFDEAAFPDGVNARQVDRIERCLYRNWDSAAYFGHLRRYDLPETKRFKDFSRGMKMKLALAVALSHGAKLLLLDEATGGLDPFARDELLRELEDFIADGQHAVLLSSHIVSDIEKLCGRVVFLHKGQVLLDEEKGALLAAHPNKTLEDILLGMIEGGRSV